MNRLEMAQKLFENQNLRAKNNYGNVAKTKKNIKDGENWIDIVWEKDENYVLDLTSNFREEWNIIELKLKEFTFEEVLEYWRKNNIPVFTISNSKGKNLYKNTLNWYDMCETWIVEGVYEDE